MEEVKKSERKDGGIDSISEDLESKLDALLSRIGRQSDEEIVEIRMNELALSKVTPATLRSWFTHTANPSFGSCWHTITLEKPI